jgi:hypothetical protein
VIQTCAAQNLLRIVKFLDELVDNSKNKEERMKRQIIVVVCLVGLLGWFGVQAVQAQEQGKVMQGSGFKTWNVDTPKEKTFFDKHPQDTITTYQKGDKVLHVYKDPKTGVVYVGDEAALQAYLQTAKGQGMTAKEKQKATEASDRYFWDIERDE